MNVSFVLFSSRLYAQNTGLVQYVNTRQGTNSDFALSRGNTYPLVALSFGINSWAPQTDVNSHQESLILIVYQVA
ncbi:hypothetical protein KHS38_09935 [Mucilaginibacter sp. Bleaf8]|nr:hypothetical protein [Mucilaginibacter sp. Bleaf8]